MGMSQPATLSRAISPPPRRRSAVEKSEVQREESNDANGATIPQDEIGSGPVPKLAAIEAGQAQIRDHLDYFSTHFRNVRRPTTGPALSLDSFRSLYKRNEHQHGCHFIVHQHDHPISGVHYDLRLQFSDSSTLSFAIPYGLPGNPNSVRPNRLAVETRVHTLWNNLIETASHATGSLLIWDTGEYEILPWKEYKTINTDDELSEHDGSNNFGHSQAERLCNSFQRRRIRLRLQGTRLPPNYTISMWLPSSHDRRGQTMKPKRKRRRVEPSKAARHEAMTSDDSDSDEASTKAQKAQSNPDEDTELAAIASDDDEDSAIRLDNAYPGAKNTIGSEHQRYWFLTLDKRHSGFRKVRHGPDEGIWMGNWEPFFVRGRNYERSIVTGRNADEVMEDEGVEAFVGRKMWRPIME